MELLAHKVMSDYQYLLKNVGGDDDSNKNFFIDLITFTSKSFKVHLVTITKITKYLIELNIS